MALTSHRPLNLPKKEIHCHNRNSYGWEVLISAPKTSDEDFIRIFKELGPDKTAKELGLDVRNVMRRRRRIEERHDILIESPQLAVSGAPRMYSENLYPARVPLTIENGVQIISSDHHCWPGIKTTAHRGLVHLSKELQPDAQTLNGDIFDGARNNRHARIGWSQKPTVQQEMEAVAESIAEIRDACPKAKRHWNMGNHDARFETKLSNSVQEYEGVKGFALRDHFPEWKFGVSLWVNGLVVVKHRFKGGIHATHNNTVMAGKTMVTGHLHSLKVTPFDDYNGTRYGIDTGCLADAYGPQFNDYTEDNPRNHRSGFIVLTYHKGKLLLPEIVAVYDEDHIQFRGKLIKV